MQKISCLILAMLLTACSSSPQVTATATLHVSVTATQTSLPTETLEPPPIVSVNQPEVASVLTLLNFNPADHESFDPANYRIETREWGGQEVQMLIRDEPTQEGERIDAMQVTISGVEQWVRGIYYPVEGYGGMAIDVIVHPLQEQRAYFSTPEGAQAVYGELLTAIAHQKGMSAEGLQNYLETNDKKIEIVLPEFANPDNHSKNRSPSYLQASEPVTVDLSKPVVYATRSGSYINQEVAPGVTVPDGIRWVVGQSDAGIAVFVANEQLFVVYESDGNMTSDRAGSIARSYLKNGRLRLKPELGANRWISQTNSGQLLSLYYPNQ